LTESHVNWVGIFLAENWERSGAPEQGLNGFRIESSVRISGGVEPFPPAYLTKRIF
jgi:hypothetical protein